ncbi:MAG: glycosyltransferase family 2 protein, partial [Thermomicrobiales bacterium]
RPKTMEILICDDGSTDDIPSAIAPFGHSMRLKVFRQQRLGPRPASARNMGILDSTGDVILFLDDDVTFGKEFLQSHLNAHDPSLAPRLVFGFRHRLGSLAEMQTLDASSEKFPNDPRSAVIGRNGDRLQNNPIPWFQAYTCNLSISRRCLPAVFDDSFVGWGCEDIDFAYRLWKGGVEIHCQPKAVVIHVDQAKLSDPFVNRRLGRPSDFNSFALNTVRMMLKYPDDLVLQSTLSSNLAHFSIQDDNCVSAPTGGQIEAVLAWAKDRIRRASSTDEVLRS